MGKLNYFAILVDTVGKRKRSQIMAKVRSRGNASTELKALKLLRSYKITGWRRGVRLFGKPDFVFLKSKVALFIDGCFWHGCPRCYRAPKSAQDYWSAKVARNKRRDVAVSKLLKSQGWKVLRIRECQLKSPNHLLRLIKSNVNIKTP
jgi:DNA mismatch endonuclease (patch repair protein)